MKRRRLIVCATYLPTLLLAACKKRMPAVPRLAAGASVLALGDSLTLGYGAQPDESWPAALARQTGWQVVNQSVNGDTSAGALQRLEVLLAGGRYDAILIGIGGNDMLRGVPRQVMRDNLVALVRVARMHTPKVALIATPTPDPMRATFGVLGDAPVYEQVAEEGEILLIPEVYAGVLSDAALRSDQIHANAKGYEMIAQKLADKLKSAGWR